VIIYICTPNNIYKLLQYPAYWQPISKRFVTVRAWEEPRIALERKIGSCLNVIKGNSVLLFSQDH